MTGIMSSRRRMLSALARLETDRVPCSFMMYGGLKSTCRDYEEFIRRQLLMGLDAFVELPPRPPIVANDVVRNGDGRRLSFAVGTWRWTVGDERP